ncbi:hypothetical protein [Halorarius halobius]|uniref:hypothetical protein n=1 Tax=Halorarius halobius TaxID=2962671 RepID=UPI0020CBA4C5|nr:hypothetical protein [Halorarius halobius]
MNRRNTLKALGSIGVAATASLGTASASKGGDGNDESPKNPGRVNAYNGRKTLATPDLGGFDHVLVYLAEPKIEGEWDGVEKAEHFQREIMDRTTDEIMANRRTAETFYEERFGIELESFDGEDELFEPKTTDDGKAVLNPAYQDPDVGYHAYVVSGRGMPNPYDEDATNRDEMRTGKVRDGGWHVTIREPMTLHGTYGGEEGVEIDAPSLLAFGNYNIKMGDQEAPIVLDFKSADPILVYLDGPKAFNCDLSHDDWGAGAARGVIGLPGGAIRNVLTFPANR